MSTNKIIYKNNKLTNLSINLRQTNSIDTFDNQNLFGLNMLSFNCRSIRNKVTEVTSKLEELQVDVCMLQETWLSKGDESVIAEIKDYGFEMITRRRPTGRKGGGVAVMYKSYINMRMIKSKTNFKSIEHLICTIIFR